MANEITNLLPFRQYDDNDVINMFAMEGTDKAAGTLVKVSAANLNDDLIDLIDGGSAFLTSQGNAYSPLSVNPLRVDSAGSETQLLEFFFVTFATRMKMARSFVSTLKRKKSFSAFFLENLCLSQPKESSL